MKSEEDLKIHRQTLEMIARDRWAAHKTLFIKRHPDQSPRAHRELVEAIYSPEAHRLIEAFRGFGKSTYLEEAAIIRACFREFHNMVIVGASERRAAERLTAIKRELDFNETILKLFGQMRGPVWQETKIVLANGVCIQALGRDQSLLGIKYLEYRPDAALIDDVEDPDEVRSEEGREKTWDWFLKALLPALDDPMQSWVRVLGTRRGEHSLPARLEGRGWITTKFPIERIDEEGNRRAVWPSKFPLPKIDQMKALYAGDMHTFAQEYMCQASSAADRIFTDAMIHVRPRVRTWEACYAMYDPARTTGPQSATTGKVVWSWLQNRLVVWEASARKWKPDEIIADIFATAEEYNPIWLGVEEDGLNEFILQPLRHEQIRHGQSIPIKPLRAPRGKLDFIRALQPFFAAGEVEFAKPLPELETQLLSFPAGAIDAPNALAYALSMRPGQAVVDGFTLAHVAETLGVDRARPCWLACNATKALTTAALIQYSFGRLSILADFAMEGEPGETVPLILREVGMMARLTPTACCPPIHWDRWMNVGLVQALQRVPLTAERGTEPLRGREALRAEFGRLVRAEPAVRIARLARHTLNALSGGYSRQMTRQGVLTQDAEPGLYKTLMEGIESCVGAMAMQDEIHQNANYSYTQDGRRYMRYGSTTR